MRGARARDMYTERGFVTPDEASVCTDGRWVTSGDENTALCKSPCRPGTSAPMQASDGSWPCEPCAAGLYCPGGNATATAESGWFVGPTGPVRCYIAGACERGGCRRGHIGDRCTLCLPGWYRDSDSQTCKPCSPVAGIVLPLFVLVTLYVDLRNICLAGAGAGLRAA